MGRTLKKTVIATIVILGLWFIGQQIHPEQIQAAQDYTYTLRMADDNQWYYYKGDKIYTDYTGLAQNEYGWFYVKNGVLDWNYTGLAQNEYGWFYVKGGILDWSYTGLAQNEYGWFYVKDGMIDWNYTGLAYNEYGWFYVKGGMLDWSYTGLAQNEYGWFYVKGGMLDWSYTGLVYNENGWFYVKGGMIDWNYTGTAYNENGGFYIKGGMIDWSYTGVVKQSLYIYVVENGQVVRTTETQLNIKPVNKYYIYEYAYKTGDTSFINTEEQKKFYDGLSAYLDNAYMFSTQYEQEVAVHDYMILNSKYDNSYDIPDESYMAEGIIMNKTGVCDGYSNAFKLCMDILGIPCKIIRGVANGGGHSWNAVMLDDEWYMVDVTWDDPLPDKPGRVLYGYLNVTDEQLKYNHSYTSDISATGTKYYYLGSQDNCFTDTTEFYNYANDKLTEASDDDVSIISYVVRKDGVVDSDWLVEWMNECKVDYMVNGKYRCVDIDVSISNGYVGMIKWEFKKIY